MVTAEQFCTILLCSSNCINNCVESCSASSSNNLDVILDSPSKLTYASLKYGGRRHRGPDKELRKLHRIDGKFRSIILLCVNIPLQSLTDNIIIAPPCRSEVSDNRQDRDNHVTKGIFFFVRLLGARIDKSSDLDQLANTHRDKIAIYASISAYRISTVNFFPSPQYKNHSHKAKLPKCTTTTFSDLLLGFNEGASVDIESSSSSDEDELHCEERTEHEEDGLINANGRTWTPCEAVLVDPGAHIQPRRAWLLWPQPLTLGDRTLAKYFYLMYPMSTLPSTMSSTNRNHQKKQSPYQCGGWFKWIGIRLAMAYEPRRGPLPTYWEHRTQAGGVGNAASFGQRFGMTRH
ncbi:unnamed protein product [Phytophthora fragariaefolia]|uniref:Unnamed protein product n=1 Tax=Phytophthora fragariaefolia TaxID=1490495 RepID=A0A9W6XPH8_9STRA|nr:unnamed protein product [Phytophthora fragariaefolia]